MGQKRMKSSVSFADEIDIRVILDEHRKAEARVAEAKKNAGEIIARAREQAKLLLARAQERASEENMKMMIEEERRKALESFQVFEKQEAEKLERLKSILESSREALRKALLDALLG